MRLSHSFILLLTLFSTNLLGQSKQTQKCGIEWAEDRLIEKGLLSEKDIKDFDELISQYSETSSRTNAILTIPVVVHVIHEGESVGNGTNLSQIQVQSQIQALNRDFRRLNNDANNTPELFMNATADTQIEFCLVSQNPNGTPTSGIMRHQYTNIPDIDYIEEVIKPDTRWDSNKYLNIWTVNMPKDYILGYAYLPSTSMVGSIADGVVISYKKFGNISSINNGRTTTHEMGHYLGLKHTWGNNESCGSDDNISDTPQCEDPYYGCPSHPQTSCGSTDMFMNYMDYVDDNCMNMFSQGQTNVMRSILSTQRSSLISNATGCFSVSTKEYVDSGLVSFYPNPASDQIFVEIAPNFGSKDLKVSLLDQWGRQIWKTDYSNQNQIEIDIEAISDGLYLLHFESEQYQNTQKLMIIR